MNTNATFQWVALLLSVILGGAQAQEPAANPTWLVAGPRASEVVLAPLMEIRKKQGLEVRFLAFEDLDQEGKLNSALRERIRSMKPAPRFFLIVGDGEGEEGEWVLAPLNAEGPGDGPPVVKVEKRKGATVTTRIFGPHSHDSDVPFGDLDGDGLPEISVGRLPARNGPELEAMITKIVGYETSSKGGAWQGRMTFITGEGRFGLLADMLMEKMFARVVREAIPFEHQIRLTYSSPRSPYFWPPREFSTHVKARLEERSLFFTYVGHGWVTSVDRVGSGVFAQPVMDVETVKGLHIGNGKPIVTVIACWTAAFTHARRECIGEVLMRAPDGPVSFFGAIIPSNPYGNAILGYELARTYANPKIRTVGEALAAAHQRMATNPDDALRRSFDAVGSKLTNNRWTQEQDRFRHISMYILLGDPALSIRRPGRTARFEVADSVTAGEPLAFAGNAAGVTGEAVVTLEVQRQRFAGKLPRRPRKKDPDFAEATKARHTRANDKVVARTTVTLEKGKFSGQIPIPESLKPGTYWLRFEGLDGHALGGRGNLILGARSIKVVGR